MITFEEFKRRAASLNGQTLFTASQRRPFAVRVLAEGLALTPSSGKERLVSWSVIDSILERFRDLRSFTPAHYHDLTFDSSYLMAILKNLSASQVTGEQRDDLRGPDASSTPEPVDRDSSKTRVTPIFDCLYGVDPSGSGWLLRLLRLGSRSENFPEPFAGPSLVARHGQRWGPNEVSLPAPVALLQHLVRTVDPSLVEKSKDQGELLEKRRALGRRDPATVANALSRLEELRLTGKRPGKEWYVLEGPSRPDALLESEDFVLCIEGKRTENCCTTTTKFMSCRSQLVRHMDAAMEEYPEKRIFGLLIVEGSGGSGAKEPSDHWRAECRAQYAEEMLRESLPHRPADERQAIADRILGLTTWQAVSAEFRIPLPPAP
jgi:hypothetical protein